jgi:hypothetical protein
MDADLLDSETAMTTYRPHGQARNAPYRPLRIPFFWVWSKVQFG